MKALAALALLSFGLPARGAGTMDFPLPRRGSPALTAINALETKPRFVLVELRALYQRYADLVARKRDDGWEAGLLSGAVVERPEQAVLPARQLEDSLRRREAEMKALLSRLDRLPPGPKAEEAAIEIQAAQKELRAVRRQNGRAKGLSVDWSDAVWAELRKEEAEEWALFDEVRQSPPRHTAAVACTPPKRHALCLSFDPWRTGEPHVYEYNSWKEGSFDSRIPTEYFLHHLPETE